MSVTVVFYTTHCYPAQLRTIIIPITDMESSLSHRQTSSLTSPSPNPQVPLPSKAQYGQKHKTGAGFDTNQVISCQVNTVGPIRNIQYVIEKLSHHPSDTILSQSKWLALSLTISSPGLEIFINSKQYLKTSLRYRVGNLHSAPINTSMVLLYIRSIPNSTF